MNTAKDLRMGPAEWALLLLLSLLWGSTFFFWKVLVAALPPFTVVLGRVGLAALALNFYLLLRGRTLGLDLRLWRSFVVMGVLNNVIPFVLIVWGELRISSGLASILNATTPVFTVLVAHVLTDNEKLSWAKGVGLALGFAGVIVLIGPGEIGAAPGDKLGELACLGAAAVYAFAGLYGRRFKDRDPILVATGQVSGSTMVLIPLALAIDHPWDLAMPGPAIWTAFFGTAILCTALAYVVYFRILAAAGPTNLLLVTLLLPVSALLLGGLFLDERIGAQALAGMTLIAAGLGAIDGRIVDRLRIEPRKLEGKP